jgi:hypothetical protein
MSHRRSADTPSVSLPTNSSDGSPNGSRDTSSSSLANESTGRIRTGGGTSSATHRCGRIPIYGRDGVVAYASVNLSDLAWLSGWRWHPHPGGYARAWDGPSRRHVYMHRLIMGLAPGDRREVDHDDLNKLNNCRNNLAVGSSGDNKQNLTERRADNTSGYRGVTLHCQGRWQAQAWLDGKRYYLGLHDTPEQAAVVVQSWRATHMPCSKEARHG